METYFTILYYFYSFGGELDLFLWYECISLSINITITINYKEKACQIHTCQSIVMHIMAIVIVNSYCHTNSNSILICNSNIKRYRDSNINCNSKQNSNESSNDIIMRVTHRNIGIWVTELL